MAGGYTLRHLHLIKEPGPGKTQREEDTAAVKAAAVSSLKYLSKFDDLRIRVPLGEKEQISQHTAKHNGSLNTFVRRAISETMERGNNKA